MSVHIIEHHIAPPTAILRIDTRIIVSGGLQHSNQHGTLVNCKFFRLLAIICLRGRAYAIGVASEVHSVEIHRKYFFLGIEHFYFHSRNPFLCLHYQHPDTWYIAKQPGGIFRSGLEHIFYQLLRYGTCPTCLTMDNHILYRSKHTLEIDTEMVIETLILG